MNVEQNTQTTAAADWAVIMTDKEVAEYLRVSPRQVHNLLRRGLPHFHIESSLRFRRADIEEWIAAKVKGAGGNSPNATTRTTQQ